MSVLPWKGLFCHAKYCFRLLKVRFRLLRTITYHDTDKSADKIVTPFLISHKFFFWGQCRAFYSGLEFSDRLSLNFVSWSVLQSSSVLWHSSSTTLSPVCPPPPQPPLPLFLYVLFLSPSPSSPSPPSDSLCSVAHDVHFTFTRSFDLYLLVVDLWGTGNSFICCLPCITKRFSWQVVNKYKRKTKNYTYMSFL